MRELIAGSRKRLGPRHGGGRKNRVFDFGSSVSRGQYVVVGSGLGYMKKGLVLCVRTEVLSGGRAPYRSRTFVLFT